MKKISKKIISILMILIMISASISSLILPIYAASEALNINVATDKTDYELNETVTVTVNWEKDMQAADFELQYDASKLRFSTCSLEENYYNLYSAGRLLISWADENETSIKEVTFTFTTLAKGETTINVKPRAFDAGNFDTEYTYNAGSKIITIGTEDGEDNNVEIIDGIKYYDTVDDYFKDELGVEEVSDSIKSNMTYWVFEGICIRNWEGICEYKNINNIQIEDTIFDSIDFSQLPNLKRLHILDSTILNFDCLNKLKGLEYLGMVRCDFRNDFDFSELKCLKELFIWGNFENDINGILDISSTGFQNLTNLETLKLGDIICEDVKLDQLTNLKELELYFILNKSADSFTDVADFSVESLELLEILRIDSLGCSKLDLRELKNLTSLEVSDLYESIEYHLESDSRTGVRINVDELHIEELTQLEELKLGYMPWKEQMLSKLLNLKELSITCLLEEVKHSNLGIDKLVNLEKLYIWSLNSSLNLINNLNLKTLDITISKNMESSTIDLTGLREVEYINYKYPVENGDININKVILTDRVLNFNKEVKNDYITYNWYGTIEEEYIKNPVITEKEVGDKSAISGIGGNKKVEDFLNQKNFNEEYTVKVYDSKGAEVASTTIMGTGLKVKLVDEAGHVVQEYTVIVYGDTDGDGSINAFDALTLIKGINKKVDFKGEEYKEAGRIMTEGTAEPSAVDALAIVKAANNKYTINQSK